MSHIDLSCGFLPGVESSTHWRSCELTVIIKAQGDISIFGHFQNLKSWICVGGWRMFGCLIGRGPWDSGVWPFCGSGKLQIKISNQSWFLSREHRDLARFISCYDCSIYSQGPSGKETVCNDIHVIISLSSKLETLWVNECIINNDREVEFPFTVLHAVLSVCNFGVNALSYLVS